jgi:Zn-dependent protease with chaperone function
MKCNGLMALGIMLLLAHPLWAQRWSAETEKKLGAEAAAEIEKKWKVYEDKPALAKLQAMADEIVKLTVRPDVKYVVKLLDMAEANAFSIPGGTVYVTKGLLKDAQSDDELAGVLAHEIAHNTNYDSLDGADKDKKLFMGSAAAALAAILVGARSDMVGGVLAAGDFVRRGVLSGYSIDIESRADKNGMAYMLKTHYNAVGLLTFMERLAAEEHGRPHVVLGVFQDHPISADRCRAMIGYLDEAGVDINRRATTKWEKPVVEEAKIGEKPGVRVKLWGETILETACAGDCATVKDRGNKVADALTTALAAGIEEYDVRAGKSGGKPCLLARDLTVFYPVAEDAPAGKAAEDVAQSSASALKRALYNESLKRIYSSPN